MSRVSRVTPTPPDNELFRPIRLVPLKSGIGRGSMKLRPARAKIIAALLDTLMAILHSLSHR